MDDATKATVQALNEHQAIKDILTAGGIGLAGGIGVSGLLGLPTFFGRPAPKSDPRAPGPSVVTIPTPVYSTAADQLRAQRLKTAFAETRADLPYYYPGMTAAGLAGFGGGAWLMNKFLKHKSESDLKAQEDAARSEYQKAMLEQYDPKLLPTADRVPVSDNRRVLKQLDAAPDMPQLKLASDETMADLDKLADLYLEKKALELPEVPSMNNLLGLYGAYAIPAAAIGGYATYQHFKDRAPETLVQRAIKDRERERWSRRPPEIYAVPQPVHVDRSGVLSEVAPKTAAEKKALFVPPATLLGAVIGASQAPKNNRWRGAGRGAALGASTSLGATLGGATGYLAGRAASPEAGSLLGLGGVAAGGLLAYHALKEPIWGRPWKPDPAAKPNPAKANTPKVPEKSAGVLTLFSKSSAALGTGLMGGRGLGAAASAAKPLLGGLKSLVPTTPRLTAAPAPRVAPGTMNSTPEPNVFQPGYQHPLDGLGSWMAGIGKDYIGGASDRGGGVLPGISPPGAMKDMDKYVYRGGGVGYYKLPPPPGPSASKLGPDSFVPPPPASSPVGRGWQGNGGKGK